MKPAIGQGMFWEQHTSREALEAASAPVVPLNSTVEPEDVQRLGNHQRFILERLRRGPVTNRELCRITHRFGGRLDELDAAGFVHGKVNCGGGLWVYFLLGEISSETAELYGREWLKREGE